MYCSQLYMTSVNYTKIAAGLYHGLGPLPGPPAGLCHGVPGEGVHHLHNQHHQGGCSVTGVFLDILSANATNITVQGVTVWSAWGQDLLGPEIQEVHQAPGLGSHGLVWQVDILLKD